MATVTVSSRYQITIPREIRESMGIRPGHKLEVIPRSHTIVLVPVRDIRELRGFVKGIDTTVERDREDRV